MGTVMALKAVLAEAVVGFPAGRWLCVVGDRAASEDLLRGVHSCECCAAVMLPPNVGVSWAWWGLLRCRAGVLAWSSTTARIKAYTVSMLSALFMLLVSSPFCTACASSTTASCEACLLRGRAGCYRDARTTRREGALAAKPAFAGRASCDEATLLCDSGEHSCECSGGDAATVGHALADLSEGVR